MKKLLFWSELFLLLWQFPQLLLSGVILVFCYKNIISIQQFHHSSVIFMKNIDFIGGISFGKFIFINVHVKPETRMELIRHEYGHSIQSKILGPLYLLIIGIPSVANLMFYYKKLSKNPSQKEKLTSEYYTGFPENWAQKLRKIA